ncbi:hypothetical protein BaRGS_00000642 [Batillaria attramentaria]|uniref:Uncharacterized protein n=1 Tax=Batillaria attramentaria TaxID=370345 RepID=A0ABD0M978_9CAEN
MLPEAVGRSYVYRYGTVSHTALAMGRNPRLLDCNGHACGQHGRKGQWSGAGTLVPDFVADKLKLLLCVLKTSVVSIDDFFQSPLPFSCCSLFIDFTRALM